MEVPQPQQGDQQLLPPGKVDHSTRVIHAYFVWKCHNPTSDYCHLESWITQQVINAYFVWKCPFSTRETSNYCHLERWITQQDSYMPILYGSDPTPPVITATWKVGLPNKSHKCLFCMEVPLSLPGTLVITVTWKDGSLNMNHKCLLCMEVPLPHQWLLPPGKLDHSTRALPLVLAHSIVELHVNIVALKQTKYLATMWEIRQGQRGKHTYANNVTDQTGDSCILIPYQIYAKV